MNHTWVKHEPGHCPQDGHCAFCDGGIGACSVCGGLEGSLTKDCCGFLLNEYILDAIYKGGLNFEDGHWTVHPEGIPYFKQITEDDIYIPK